MKYHAMWCRIALDVNKVASFVSLSHPMYVQLDLRRMKDVFLLDCCVECNAALVAERYSEDEVYESANIYVRKITEEHSKEDVQAILEVTDFNMWPV
jgi:hypothetical protein